MRLLRDVCEGDTSYLYSGGAFIVAPDHVDRWHLRAYCFASYLSRRYLIAGPRRAFHSVKWFTQRGRRGWADCDTWSLDWYIDGWMPDALRYLKANKHGLPHEMFEGLPTSDENGFCPTDEARRIAQERWNSILNRMIAGFEAGQRMSEGLYNPELNKRDQELFNEGMALFVEHYRSLWD